MQTVSAEQITIVDLTAEDAAEALQLSKQEVWPHRLEDWQLLFALSQAVGARCDGKLVGTAVLTSYGETGATCNMIIVDPAMRGLGLGRKLVEALLAKAGDRECRLIATQSGLPLYEKLGFVATGEIRQCQGIVSAASDASGVSEASRSDLADIVALDRAALGFDRSELLSRLIDEKPFLLVRDESGLRGFASCRAFGRGHILGPVVAKDDATFERLLGAAIARHQGQFLRVDLTDAATSFVDQVEKAGLAAVGGGVAMTRAGSAKLPTGQGACVYTLASQALC